MAEVISASGIRPSTIYQYFSNKDEIVWAILGERDGGSCRARQRRVSTGQPPGSTKSLQCFNTWPMSWPHNQA